MGPSGRIGYILDYIALFGIGYAGFGQVLYLGRAPRTKETLPDFHEKCWITRHSRVFRGLTSSQRTPGFWGVTTTLLDCIKTHPNPALEASQYIVYPYPLFGTIKMGAEVSLLFNS